MRPAKGERHRVAEALLTGQLFVHGVTVDLQHADKRQREAICVPWLNSVVAVGAINLGMAIHTLQNSERGTLENAA
jgi:hypothetical protein